MIILPALIGLLLVMPVNKEVITTCAMVKTTSQKLSNRGRVQLVKDCLSIWKETPVTGVGAGNFNIVYDGRSCGRKASSSRATNTYALILVEKGILGFIAYSGLILSVFVTGARKIKKGYIPYLFFSCFVALCLRGLFFSSVFKRRVIMLLIMMIVFGVVQENDKDEAVE